LFFAVPAATVAAVALFDSTICANAQIVADLSNPKRATLSPTWEIATCRETLQAARAACTISMQVLAVLVLLAVLVVVVMKIPLNDALNMGHVRAGWHCLHCDQRSLSLM